MSSLSLSSFSPLILALVSALLAYHVHLTWTHNKTAIATVERTRSDLRLEMDKSQDCQHMLKDLSRSVYLPKPSRSLTQHISVLSLIKVLNPN